MTQTPDKDIVVAATAAALLSQGAKINLASCGLELIGIGGLLAAGLAHAHPASLLAVVLSCAGGLAQLWLAVRVGFDAAIFRHFAGNREPQFDPSAFDLALRSLGQGRNSDPARPMAARAQGAMQLLRMQAAACTAQAALLIMAVIITLLLERA